jgi:hypothetical protein
MESDVTRVRGCTMRILGIAHPGNLDSLTEGYLFSSGAGRLP